MHFDEMTDNGQPQSQAAVPARTAVVGLTKAIKHKGEKLGADALAGVRHSNLGLRVGAFKPDLDTPAPWSELDSVGEQVPGHLLQAMRVAGDQPDMRIKRRLQFNHSGVSRRTHRLQRRFNQRDQVYRANIETELA